jgi:hypothetical protein
MLCVAPIAMFAESPMSGWEFADWGGATLNGVYFTKWQYASSFREQEGYALIGNIRQRFWLYDSYAYHGGNTKDIYQIAASWVEGMGYVIDFDNIQKINPSPGIASSVKALMSQRGCDVAVALFPGDRGAVLVIHEYSKTKGIYWTTIYPLYK